MGESGDWERIKNDTYVLRPQGESENKIPVKGKREEGNNTGITMYSIYLGASAGSCAFLHGRECEILREILRDILRDTAFLSGGGKEQKKEYWQETESHRGKPSAAREHKNCTHHSKFLIASEKDGPVCKGTAVNKTCLNARLDHERQSQNAKFRFLKIYR